MKIPNHVSMEPPWNAMDAPPLETSMEIPMESPMECLGTALPSSHGLPTLLPTRTPTLFPTRTPASPYPYSKASNGFSMDESGDEKPSLGARLGDYMSMSVALMSAISASASR